MYKSLLFDLGNVVISFDFSIGFRRMEALSGVPAPEVRARLAKTDLFHRFETGLLPGRDFSDRVQETVGFRCEYSEFCKAWNSIFLREPLIPADVLANLRQTYRLLIVSNTNSIHFEMLRETYPILDNFDGFVLSHEVGATKPDPRFYAAALAAAGVPAENCLFIDDLRENAQGARQAGIEAVQFESFDQLRDEFLRRRIL